MTFKIDLDVPKPAVRSQREAKYPFADMVEGSSFFVTEDKISAVRAAVSGQNKRQPESRFSTRKVEDGYRVFCDRAVGSEPQAEEPAE